RLAHVLFGYESSYSPDASELALPDVAAARRLLDARRPDIPQRLAAITSRFGLDPRALDAAILATARLALRHGSLGGDFHAYHNETHVLEVGERRLLRMLEGIGEMAAHGDDIAALLLFGACHDLRQREPYDFPGPVGGNEAASSAEAFRILDACGFDRAADRALYVALELMISGSTFDARPTVMADPQTNELPNVAGGALARGLHLWLDASVPRWRESAEARRGERLARLAADLDTANVGEDYVQLSETALRLCREREMRAGRPLDGPDSAQPCLGFLGAGQEYYFYELHQFSSREGERVFGPQKASNGPRVRATTAALHARFAAAPPVDGEAVLAAFAELTGAS
ncbi:MAG: hypothetical protein ABI588_05060, partial [Arenimonas sp.]